MGRAGGEQTGGNCVDGRAPAAQQAVPMDRRLGLSTPALPSGLWPPPSDLPPLPLPLPLPLPCPLPLHPPPSPAPPGVCHWQPLWPGPFAEQRHHLRPEPRAEHGWAAGGGRRGGASGGWAREGGREWRGRQFELHRGPPLAPSCPHCLSPGYGGSSLRNVIQCDAAINPGNSGGAVGPGWVGSAKLMLLTGAVDCGIGAPYRSGDPHPARPSAGGPLLDSRGRLIGERRLLAMYCRRRSAQQHTAQCSSLLRALSSSAALQASTRPLPTPPARAPAAALALPSQSTQVGQGGRQGWRGGGGAGEVAAGCTRLPASIAWGRFVPY